MDLLYGYFERIRKHLSDQESGRPSTLTVDDLLFFLRNSSEDQLNGFIEQNPFESHKIQAHIASLLIQASDRLPFQISFDKDSSPQDCTVSQFAVPLMLQFDHDDSVSFNSEMPPIIKQMISEELKNMIGISESDTLIINDRLLTAEQLFVSPHSKYFMPEQLMNHGWLATETTEIAIDHVEGGNVVYLYCLAIRPDDAHFQGHQIDKLFFNPESILESRERISQHFSIWFGNKKIPLSPYCGIPGTIPICVEAAKATQREIRFTAYYRNSALADHRDILAIINHNEVEGIIVRLYSDNHCILVFSYGHPLIYDREGLYLDHELLASRLRREVTERVLMSEKSTNCSHIGELVDQPLITSS